MARPWRNLRVRVDAAAPVGYVRAEPKPYAAFLENAELTDTVARVVRTLLSQTWTQETTPVLHLSADVKTVLASYVALVAFEKLWDPAFFLREFREWHVKDKEKVSEEALKTTLANLLRIKIEDLQGWCMSCGLEILQDHWGFDLKPLQDQRGPPVPTDDSVDKKVQAHLYACLYDMGETKASERDPRLLGIVGQKRTPLQLVPPRRLTIPHPVQKSRVVGLVWVWPASPSS